MKGRIRNKAKSGKVTQGEGRWVHPFSVLLSEHLLQMGPSVSDTHTYDLA